MRGLLVKDMKLMKNQKYTFLVLGIIGLLNMFINDNPYFAVSYMTVMAAMFSIATMNYDDFDNGGAYLFTLPFDRKTYVIEKYVFGFLFTVVDWSGISVLTVIVAKFQGMDYRFGEWAAVSVASMALSIIFICLSLPIELKFGAEKGRIGSFIVLGIFFLLFYLLFRMLDMMGGADPLEMLERVLSLRVPVLAAGVCVFCIAIVCVSVLSSICVIRKKEY